MRIAGRSLAAAAAVTLGGSALFLAPSIAVAAPVEGNILINEVESSGGEPGDWIEFVNIADESVDLGGYIVRDNKDDSEYVIPAGTTVAAGEHLVLDELQDSGAGHFDFGLGKDDSVRLFAPDETLVVQQSWEGHAEATYGLRVVDGAPVWGPTAVPTKGETNRFEYVVVNEVNYDDAATGVADAVELYNAGALAVDLSGWSIHDDKEGGRPGEGVIAAGTVLEPGEFLVLEGDDVDFTFGLGKGDSVILHDAGGVVADRMDYENTAPLAVWARCPDGTGDWAPATELTLGAPNNCEPLVVVEPALILNEIDSGPADWIEFVNPGAEALDISGYEVRDNSDDHRWRFPEGSTIEAGEYLVVDSDTVGLAFNDANDTWAEGTFGAPIGIGSGDSIRVYDAAGELIQEHSWTGHANIDGDEVAASLGRCPDTTGAFGLNRVTPGAPNDCVMPAIAINEIESNGDLTDWAEIINTGDTPVDISGWTLMDNDPIGHGGDVTPLVDGTVLEPGALFVFDGGEHFTFGLGKDDVVTIRDAQGQTVAEHAYTGHAAGVYARCPDGSGDFIDVEVSTPGQLNACGNPVVLNEVESSDAADGDDWIELYNPSANALDISGLVIKDSNDDHAYEIPAGTVLDSHEYRVITETEFGFGLGSSDSVRIFEEDNLVEETSWTEHAAQTWGRCADATGNFADTQAPTPGAVNSCIGIPDVIAWPGADNVSVLDPETMFLEDSSGLDFHDGALWAVDNGTGTIWKLDAAIDGTVTFAEGWENGKRVDFQKDADAVAAALANGTERPAGPDAEGITVDGSGLVYLAVERDNSNKGANFNAVLAVDPNKDGTNLVADSEWDLTESLPAVGANVGIEAIEWVSNDVAAGAFIDANTGAAFDPATYPSAAADGIFFVAMEDNGLVFAYVLNEDGSAVQLAEFDPGIGGAMGLDYDSVLGVLWVEADDGFNGRLAQLDFNGTATPDVLHVQRPESLPNINNEGFATATADYCVDGQRPAWWFADGEQPEALRTTPVSCVAAEVPGETPTPTVPGETPGATPGDDSGDDVAGDNVAGDDSVGDDAAGDDVADGTDEATDGDLAQTGAQGFVWVIVVAAVLLIAGLVLFFVRRRGAAAETPTDE